MGQFVQKNLSVLVESSNTEVSTESAHLSQNGPILTQIGLFCLGLADFQPIFDRNWRTLHKNASISTKTSTFDPIWNRIDQMNPF